LWSWLHFISNSEGNCRTIEKPQCEFEREGIYLYSESLLIHFFGRKGSFYRCFCALFMSFLEIHALRHVEKLTNQKPCNKNLVIFLPLAGFLALVYKWPFGRLCEDEPIKILILRNTNIFVTITNG
jgi:hypothetical protein